MNLKKLLNLDLIGKYFISGLLGLLPITVGFLILSVVFGWLKSLFGLVFSSSNPFIIALLIFVSLLFVVILGREIKNNNKIGFLRIGELWISKFPFIGKIVGIINEFTDMVQGHGKFEELGVGLVPFGGSKIYAIITNEKTDSNGIIIYTCFIVQGTFPPTGLVCYYEQKDVELVENMTPADVFQLQITLGVETNIVPKKN